MDTPNVKLTNYHPQWLRKDRVRVGFVFISPTNPRFYQTCFVAPTPTDEQFEILADHDGDFMDRHVVQPCNPTQQWSIAGGIETADFATLTVTPSLDGSAGGLWHGFITNGEIVGGLG